MRYFNLCLIIILILLYIPSCTLSKKQEIACLVREWKEKEIYYPTNIIFTLYGRDTISSYVKSGQEYTIVTYIDSLGCMSCKLQAEKWKEFILELNSISTNKIPVNIFLCPINREEVSVLLEVKKFDYPVCVDLRDSFRILNNLPENIDFRTFLLDKNSKVVAIGNPIHNPKVKELYMNIIQRKISITEKVEIHTKIQAKKQILSLGKFNWQEKQIANFTIYNVGKHPLVINDVSTSCGCISVDYPKQPVLPYDSISLQVIYKANNPEHFNKTLTVYCNAESSPLVLKIMGDAE